MAISSKDVILILLGSIGAIILGLITKNLEFDVFKSKDFSIILSIIIGVGAVIIIVYKKFKEVDNELEIQKTEQKKLDEKLKIYKRLSRIEEKVGIN